MRIERNDFTPRGASCLAEAARCWQFWALPGTTPLSEPDLAAHSRREQQSQLCGVRMLLRRDHELKGVADRQRRGSRAELTCISSFSCTTAAELEVGARASDLDDGGGQSRVVRAAVSMDFGRG